MTVDKCRKKHYVTINDGEQMSKKECMRQRLTGSARMVCNVEQLVVAQAGVTIVDNSLALHCEMSHIYLTYHKIYILPT